MYFIVLFHYVYICHLLLLNLHFSSLPLHSITIQRMNYHCKSDLQKYNSDENRKINPISNKWTSSKQKSLTLYVISGQSMWIITQKQTKINKKTGRWQWIMINFIGSMILLVKCVCISCSVMSDSLRPHGL